MDDSDELIQLIVPMERQMFQSIWRVLRHPQDAEDALQNALAVVWTNRARIACHPAPQVLIMKICADAAIDQFRRRRRNKQTAQLSLDRCLASDERTPLDEAIDHEMAEMVVQAISRLSPKQSTVIVMRYFSGLPHAAIAAALGCGIETVREHLTRGRERLCRLLGSSTVHSASLTTGTESHLNRRVNTDERTQ